MKTVLTSKTEELTTQINSLMETLMEEALSLENVACIDAKQFNMLKQCYSIVKTASDVVIACTEVIAETNSNTEKILALLRNTHTEVE